MAEDLSVRPRRRATTATRAPVPSTIWSAGSEPIDLTDPWPAPILARALAEFSAPAQQVMLVAAGEEAPQRASTIDELSAARTRRALCAQVEKTGRRAQVAISPASRVLSGALPDIDLILVSFLAGYDSQTGAKIADVAANRLREGGLLVVFTRATRTSDGILCDPTGSLVTAAQSADLLYLQHIVAVPIHDDTILAPPPADVDSLRNRADRHHGVHLDVSAFLQPRYRADSAAA